MRAPSRSRQMVWMASRPLIVGSCRSIRVTSGACRSKSSDGLLAARGRGHHFHVRLPANQQGEAVEHHAVIVDAEHADAVAALCVRTRRPAAWLGGNNGLDVRAFARHGGNDDVAAHLLGAFAHAHQPVAIVQPRRFIGIEAAPVVADAKARFIVAVIELDRHGGGVSVADRVAERLLADEQKLFVHERSR